MKRLVATAVLMGAWNAHEGLAQSILPEVQRHIDKITSCVHEQVMVEGEPCVRLEERMAQYHVPGVSIAIVRDGKIEWARGFGVASVGGSTVTAETMFQAGSISRI
jgi:CubicO group peptidase (beta-lactamase class C family)